MENKTYQKMIYKVHSRQILKAKRNLVMPLETAMSDYPEMIVSLNDSQLLRFIDELNGVTEVDEKIREIKKKIKFEKKRPRSRETKVNIKNLYRNLYELQFKKEYVCVIMDSNADYDRINQGFTINGIQFRRFLGTNGGIKNSTIVYVNAELYPELKRRLDNGRDMTKALVPAKLEAYQALVCSGSTPLPPPKGFIVVDDCITHFKDDVILIRDDNDGEPLLTYENGYDIEHNNSDGFGLMLPSYSCRVNEYLTGESTPLSGMNTRYSFEKGMVYTFDYIEFAENVAGTYEITDVWGDKRDVRDAEVILTASMLKLWDSYDSWEDYHQNCQENHYQFSTPKITPATLENVRTTNYQFLQSYEFTDEELQELCQPTIDEINDVLGMDYRKSLVFLAGYALNEKNIKFIKDDYIKALMIEPEMINDPYVRRNIYSMIKKRIDCAKKGSIKVNANYAMISGDPYALAQSMFGLEVTGLLKAGEVYHKYWIDKGADEIVCFRAPMNCFSNIRKMKLCLSQDAAYWFQYITTASIFNAWDTACEAMSGQDFDGDTNMVTNTPVLLSNTTNSPTIICVPRKAQKKIPTEADLIASNKIAFNDAIGAITNHVTSMYEVQAGFSKDTPEYDELSYRIKCGQHFQQAQIDACKGIIAKPMPEYWYSYRAIDKSDEKAELNKKIVAANKPYFMIYVYPSLKSEYTKYVRDVDYDVAKKFWDSHRIESINDLMEFEPKTKDMMDFLAFFEANKPVGENPCTCNRICSLFERAFPSTPSGRKKNIPFNYSILKCGVKYSKQNYEMIKDLHSQYKKETDNFSQQARDHRTSNDGESYTKEDLKERFQMLALQICPNEYELCDILIDLCYSTEKSKQFAWDIAGSTIINNLLRRNGYLLRYPAHEGDEFEYQGEQFTMKTLDLSGGQEIDYR